MQPATAQAEVEISGLTADSRQVAAGYLFAALPGSLADGRDFIPQALEKGAAACAGGAALRRYRCRKPRAPGHDAGQRGRGA